MQKHISLNLGPEYRIFAISDIHGDLRLLKKLMASLDIGGDDILVYVGDYINRGPFSADTVDFMAAQSKKKNTYVLKGNIERLGEWYLRRGDPEEIVGHFDDHRENLFKDWAARLGIPRVDMSNFAKARRQIAESFAAEAAFIRDLPPGLETEDFIFVHAGLADTPVWHESDEQSILKNDPYLASGPNRTGKWVVVGHMPVWNIPESKNTNNPVIIPSRRIIGIDGGCRVKDFSQLNALIIEKDKDGLRFSYAFAEDSPVVTAARACAREFDGGCFKDSWPDYRLELLEKGGDFSLCRRRVSGEAGLVKNEHIGMDSRGHLFQKSSCSVQLSLAKGEMVYLLDVECGAHAFVKKMSGEMGWVKKEALELL